MDASQNMAAFVVTEPLKEGRPVRDVLAKYPDVEIVSGLDELTVLVRMPLETGQRMKSEHPQLIIEPYAGQKAG